MSDLAKQITDVFDNCSLAPIVLLDGAWGVGKTHFIVHEYSEHSKQDCLLISVLGIQSLQQFHEKLIGKYLSLINESESDTAEKTVNIFSKVVGAFGDLTKSSQLIESLSGLVKQSIISKINDVTIIVDDLERIEDSSLASLILGDLFDMCSSESSIKAIVVMNDAKSSVSKSLIEKVICWKFKYELSNQDAFDIAFGTLDVSPSMQSFIIERLDEIQPLNLRVLIRLCDKMKQVSRILDTIKDEIDVESSKKTLFQKMIYLSFLHHQQDQDLDEIIKHINTPLMRDEPDARHSFYKQYIFHNESTSFIEFTLGCLSRPLRDSDLHDLHPKTNKLSDFINAKKLSRYSDEEFEVNISALIDYVSNETNPSLSLWYSSVNFLAYLYSLGVSNDQRLPNIIDTALERLEHITPSEELHFYTFSCNSGLPKNIDELRAYFEEKESKSNHAQLIEEIVNSKWRDVDKKAYTHVTTRQDPLTLKADDWLDTINNWDNNDLELFWDFCIEVKRASSLNEFFGKDNREPLPILLKSQLGSMSPCLRKGLLNRVYHLLAAS